MSQPAIVLSYNTVDRSGVFRRGTGVPSDAWTRLKAVAQEMDAGSRSVGDELEVHWPAALSLLRALHTLQKSHGFRFTTDDSSGERVQQFMRDFRATQEAGGRSTTIDAQELAARLTALGWNNQTHKLKPYQLDNLATLLSIRNGANFSVPGAGKTTVTFALHLLARSPGDILIVAAPKNAFPAWEGIAEECLLPTADEELMEEFIPLVDGEVRIRAALEGGGRRFLISYDQLVRVEATFAQFIATHPVHLVLDESHRMKAGYNSLRGASLLRMAHLAVRRDILTGTPMPQSSSDMQSQLDFLWPGVGLGWKVAAGTEPRKVMDGLYVRTTKTQLGLPERRREFVQATLSDAHCAFYSVLKDDLRSRASLLRKGRTSQSLIAARRSVVRLLQAAVDPTLVAETIDDLASQNANGLLRAVQAEALNGRIRAAVDLAERLISEGKKVLIWTIFTSTVRKLRDVLAHHNPALIYGEIGMGEADDLSTRQGNLARFKNDPNCRVMIANPAAASEGISLHMHCHDAIYVDRSYNATHFLQSIDRIHRLGLPADVVTTVYVIQNRLPAGIGSIDVSVSRRLGQKIRAMEKLLEDPDLNDLALDEENAPASLADELDAEDIDDIIAELEGNPPPATDEDLV
ncbi:DEAD/DEAH box helicase [Stenotrophomonas maltophilia]|uniref:DEAD/DEAH box helicase n=1 Tax=Stenotrophomonas TaxID=40323 RepID=UPI00066DDC89|nr:MULTISPECIES: DEAD/DEAH box helicase [Stenotrophomonas]MCU1002750.1 DEAD/DEAH box helicase [Stenotrophomonas maltophilia]